MGMHSRAIGEWDTGLSASLLCEQWELLGWSLQMGRLCAEGKA